MGLLVDQIMSAEYQISDEEQCKQIIALLDKEKNTRNKYAYLRTLTHYTLKSNKYKQCYNFGKKLIKLANKNQKIDAEVNGINNYRHLLHATILLFLRENNKKYHLEANDYAIKVKNIEVKIPESLKKEIDDDLFLLECINEGVRPKSIIKFSLPFPLGQVNQEFKFMHYDMSVKVSVELDKKDDSFWKSEDKEVMLIRKDDKHGLTNKATLTIEVDKYLLYKGYTEIDYFDSKISVNDAVIEIVEIVNEFIRLFRISSKAFWINNIDYFSFNHFELNIYLLDKLVNGVPLTTFGSGLRSVRKGMMKSTEVIDLTHQMIEKDLNHEWLSLLGDSKKAFIERSFKEALFLLNSSFESMFYQSVRRILEKKLPIENVDKIFEGKKVFSDFDISNIIDNKIFEELKNKGAITESPPSVYKLIKMISGDNDEKRMIIKSVENIRRYRNDVIHGREIGTTIFELEKHLMSAYNSFDELGVILKDKTDST